MVHLSKFAAFCKESVYAVILQMNVSARCLFSTFSMGANFLIEAYFPVNTVVFFIISFKKCMFGDVWSIQSIATGSRP